MTEKSPWVTRNKVAVAGAAVALGLLAVAHNKAPQDSDQPSNTRLSTQYAITKDCAAHPDAYQRFSLTDMQNLFVQAGLRQGHLKNEDVVTINGNAQQLTVTTYNGDERTVFPNKVEPHVVQTFPFDTLGTVAIGRLNGEAEPSVVLACNITELTDAHQPFVGQLVQQMPPQQ